jgi:hypothetical protein
MSCLGPGRRQAAPRCISLPICLLPDAGVVGEHDEDEADEQDAEVVAAVARRVEQVVEPAHELDRVDVALVLLCETPALVARDPAEHLQPWRELRDREGSLLGRLEVEDEEVLEVRGHHVPRPLRLLHGAEVVAGLADGVFEALAGGLVLDGQMLGPERA